MYAGKEKGCSMKQLSGNVAVFSEKAVCTRKPSANKHRDRGSSFETAHFFDKRKRQGETAWPNRY
jgi:hypothetical protein